MWQAAREELNILAKAKQENEKRVMHEVELLLGVCRHK